MQYSSAEVAIKKSLESLKFSGTRVESKSWQAIKGDFDTWELLNHSLTFPIPQTAFDLRVLVQPNLPWAHEHFQERISGIPYNPPPSHVRWPYATKENKEHTDQFNRFSHTYPERIWPPKDLTGIRYEYGNLNDLIDLLNKDPETRQGYLPIWYPEDTGAAKSQRVPCTLGYHFIRRHGYLHMTYYIRSCDAIRHFRDDIYLAIML